MRKPAFLYFPLTGMVPAGMGTNDMSNDLEHYSDLDNTAVALFLLENEADELTDILVAALSEAFRILEDEISPATVH